MSALLGLSLKPRPKLQTRVRGFSEDRVRLPIYLGLSAGAERSKTYIQLPNDRSFLVKIMIEGAAGSGKSVTVRNFIESLFIEWKKYGDRWRHPIIILDSKANYLGLGKPNYKARDRYLLRTIHPKYNYSLSIPEEFIHPYAPAYLAPINKREILRDLNKRWGIKGFWGVPWRHIIDLAHLGTVLKVPQESLWSEELRPSFEKASAKSELTLRDLIGKDGLLLNAAKHIRNPQTRGAAVNFVLRWRKNRWWFGDEDVLAKHLYDPFSVNILSFAETPTKLYFNQLAFLIAIESCMASLQEAKIECQPVIILHDILNFIGEGKPFRNEIIDAITRMFAGQSRTLQHGYIVMIETQNLFAMPKVLTNLRDYTIVIRMKFKSQSKALRGVSGFVGGICDLHDNFRNFHRPSVIVRPPLTSYEV